MCFSGGDGGAGDIARQQRADELARQERIKAGMATINSIFDGQITGARDAATSYDKDKTYYLADGSVFRPIPASFGGVFGLALDGLGEQFNGKRAEQLIKEGKLFTTPVRSGGFNEDFYNSRANAYTNYAMPQLDRQYGYAKDNLVYALDRSGLLSSSAANKENARLTGEYDQNRLNVQNKALDVANQTRQNVENTRASIVNQLNATGDNDAAASAAMRNAQALNAPQGMSPLGELFVNFTSGLSAIGSNARNDYSGMMGGLKTLFSNNGGSSRVVSG